MRIFTAANSSFRTGLRCTRLPALNMRVVGVRKVAWTENPRLKSRLRRAVNEEGKSRFGIAQLKNGRKQNSG